MWSTIVEYKLRETIPTIVVKEQCDQICRNFATLAKVYKSLEFFWTVSFLFGKMLSLLWQICDIIGLIFILATGQILKNNQTILSHSKRVSTAPRRSAVMDKR